MADIPFHQIPSNLRLPLFYAEVDPSHANTATATGRALLIGQKTAAGSAPANVLVDPLSVADAKNLFGQGSILAQMYFTYRKNDSFGDVLAMPVADAGGGVAAIGNISFTGPATAPGTLSLYLGGFLAPVVVTSGMTASQLATALVAAVTALPDLAVTAAIDGAHTYQVDFTAKNAGLEGNDIDIQLNFKGSQAGEATPAGIVPTITAMSTGATNPTLTTALANLGDEPFDFIAMPYTDATSIAALTAFLNDSQGRWSWQMQIYGHVFMAFRGTFSGQTTLGTGLNDQHSTVLGFNGSPTPNWKWAAALCAQAAISARADAAQPVRDVVLQDVLAPPVASRFSPGQRNTLLFDGISTFTVQAGAVVLEKVITTYQKNAFASPDNSYLDVETLFNLAFVLRTLQGVVTSKYGRSKLADDNTALPAGSGVVTPNVIKQDIIAKYGELEVGGFVQDTEIFAAAVIVQRNSQNSNRVDVLWPGVLIDRLDVFALLAQFRLS